MKIYISEYCGKNTFQKCVVRTPQDNGGWFALATDFEVLDTPCDNDDVWLANAVTELKGLGTSAVAAVKGRVTLVPVTDLDFVAFS